MPVKKMECVSLIAFNLKSKKNIVKNVNNLFFCCLYDGNLYLNQANRGASIFKHNGEKPYVTPIMVILVNRLCWAQTWLKQDEENHIQITC